jgi:hypothetical protein
VSNQDYDTNNAELLDALAKRIGGLIIQCEVMDRMIKQQSQKIKELEFALTKVAEGLHSNVE